MRNLEIALSLSTLPALIAGVLGWRGPRVWEVSALLVPALIVLLLIVIDAVRIHLLPLWVTAGILGICGAAVLMGERWEPGWLTSAAAGLGLLAVGVTSLGVWAFPIFELPKPSGPFPVGTTLVTLPEGAKVQVWYPAAAPATGSRALYWPQEGRRPPRMFDNLRLVHTHAILDAAVAKPDTAWPVVLYSPSWGGGRQENSSLCETLASEGFVVVALDHLSETALPPLDFSSEKTRDEFLDAAGRELDRQTSAILAVFGALKRLQAGEVGEGLFKGKLDIGNVGVAGYSFGGAVAAEACRKEPLLRAGVDLDGTLFGGAARDGATQPFLFVTDTLALPPESDRHSLDGATRRNAEFYTASTQDIERWLRTRGGWLIRIDNVQHANFSDRALYSNLRKYSGSGTRNPRETLSNINACVTAFFDMTLRRKESSLLRKNGQPWPGVSVEKFGGEQ